MASRDDIGNTLNELGLTGSAAEIGVLSGSFTEIVLKDWRGRAYWCVDTWERQDPQVYRETTNDTDYDKCYQQVQDRAIKDKRIIVLKGKSPAISQVVLDRSLDFVFIDANHEYNSVIDDLNAWIPKLKSGGVMGGHDYYDSTQPPDFCEVQRAVDDWMMINHYDFVTDLAEGRNKSWWTTKP